MRRATLKAPSFLRIWELLGYLLPRATRERVYQPTLFELQADYVLSYKRFRTPLARGWLRFSFAFRTVLMLAECFRVMGIAKLLLMLTGGYVGSSDDEDLPLIQTGMDHRFGNFVAAIGGTYLTPWKQLPVVTGVCTDTRRVQPGSLYIPLRGERFDGHDFVPQAAAGGAVATLVDTAPLYPLPGLRYILVDDTRIAMGRLARHVRQQMRAKVIGVAGSNGKTSTKHLIDAALGVQLRGTSSPKSFNNEIGVPLSIFPADPLQDYVVLELGTNAPGDIAHLTNIALPDIAVITNCGPEHLLSLGDLMGVRQENASVIHGLDPQGVLIVNGDDPALLNAVSGYTGRRITFGLHETNDLFATDIACEATGIRFRLNGRGREVFVPMLGRHTACNALAAIAVARVMKVREIDAIAALAKAEGPVMRLQLTQYGGLLLLNDAYNANPTSMRAALETVSALPVQPPGRRIAVLGDMLELGKWSKRHHCEIGEFAAACALDFLVCIGPQAEFIAAAAVKAGMGAELVQLYPDSRMAAHVLPPLLRDQDLVLLKASRGMRLEAVAHALGKWAAQ